MSLVKGIAVSGEYVDTIKDKTFFVISEPRYVELDDLQNEGEKVEKLLLTVRLSDGAEMEYYPNKTSIKAMVRQYGYEMGSWVNRKFVWEVNKEKGFGKNLLVLYVQDEKSDEVFVPEENGN